MGLNNDKTFKVFCINDQNKRDIFGHISRSYGRISMKFNRSIATGAWTNWLDFELDSKITQKRVHGFGRNVACRQISGHGRTD